MSEQKKKLMMMVVTGFMIFALAMLGGYAGYSLAGEGSSSNGTNIIKTSATDKATNDIATIAKSASKTVVEITTESVTNGNFMRQYVSEGAGSGVILTDDGYIITNYHVVNGASKIKVRTSDEKEYEATYVGGDAQTDVAVLKIEAKDLTVAAIGNSDKLDVGESVVAIGNPLGTLGGTVTEGIISATSREITIDNQAMTLLQTSAAINPGNSGGGLFNTNGELIGVVNAKSSGEDVEGLGFAIPINKAIEIAEQLMDKGYATGNYTIGVSMIEVNDETTMQQYDVTKEGIYVYSVEEGLPAQKAGMQSGDLLVSVNGKKASDFDTIKDQIKNSEKGNTITIVVQRDNANKTITIKVE